MAIQHDPRSQILVALDVPTLTEAVAIVEQTHPFVGGYKIGMELCNSVGTPLVIDAISSAGGEVFVDLKFADIPNTVRGAAKAVARPGVLMFNVHCNGGSAMLRAAVDGAEQGTHRPLIIGVTVLTSIDQPTLQKELRVAGTIAEQVAHLAQLAQTAGLDGVVCSAHEVHAIKEICGPNFITVVPGVRPVWAGSDDQQRIMTPADAIRQGADYLVIGRPITKPPREIGSPAHAAQRVLQELQSNLLF